MFLQKGEKSRQVHENMKLVQVKVTALAFWKPQTDVKAKMCLSASIHLNFAWLFSEGLERSLSLYCVMHVQ